jgi:hypothetical protein
MPDDRETPAHALAHQQASPKLGPFTANQVQPAPRRNRVTALKYGTTVLKDMETRELQDLNSPTQGYRALLIGSDRTQCRI